MRWRVTGCAAKPAAQVAALREHDDAVEGSHSTAPRRSAVPSRRDGMAPNPVKLVLRHVVQIRVLFAECAFASSDAAGGWRVGASAAGRALRRRRKSPARTADCRSRARRGTRGIATAPVRERDPNRAPSARSRSRQRPCRGRAAAPSGLESARHRWIAGAELLRVDGGAGIVSENHGPATGRGTRSSPDWLCRCAAPVQRCDRDSREYAFDWPGHTPRCRWDRHSVRF